MNDDSHMNHLSVFMGIPKRQMPNHNERLRPLGKRARNGAHALKTPTQETKYNGTHVQLFGTNQHTEMRGKPSMTVSTGAFRVGWQIDPHLNSLKLNSLIDDILRSEAVPFTAGGIRVRPDIAANLPPIQADEKLLKQALLNLFKNAADAMPNGGVLRVAAGADVRSVCLELADTGVGIPPDVDVFQPFVTSKPGGVGLGLVITRHIVETHGGKITYRSQPGRGTTFCVTLPRTSEA